MGSPTVRHYSPTSRKRPAKMQRLGGRLREVVAKKNRTIEGLFQEARGLGTSILLKIIYCMQSLSYAMLLLKSFFFSYVSYN